MVPAENSYRSDMAMGELIQKYPGKSCTRMPFSGVFQHHLLKMLIQVHSPFIQGWIFLGSIILQGKYNYPESPTYPLIDFIDNRNIGRLGSFTVVPFRAVDEIPRWVPLWFPSGGKSHAYNLLGGKRSFPLSFLNKTPMQF